MTKYFKEYDKRKKLFGIKIKGKRGWYVVPEFDEMGLSEIEHEVDYTHGSKRMESTVTITSLRSALKYRRSMSSRSTSTTRATP